MDYRYETKESARDFHKQRKAFLIYKNKVDFLPPNCSMSHFEYCKSKGIGKDEFNKLTRGYFFNGRLLFYKDNFIYDDLVIQDALKHINEIVNKLHIDNFNIYFGALPQEDFKPDFLYGIYKDGKIIEQFQQVIK